MLWIYLLAGAIIGAATMTFMQSRNNRIYTQEELNKAVEGEADSWIPIMQAYEKNIERQRETIQGLRRRLNEG